MKPSVSVTDRALAAARGLYDRSQPAEALAICDYILSVDPEDARVLHLSAAAQAATGRVDAALLGLAALRRSSRGFDPTLPGPTQIGCSGVAAYNEALAAEDPEQAASIADALAELFPDSVPMLRHALHANVVLERDDRVASYAERLLACEPGSLDGLSGMIDHCRRISDYTAETEYRVRLARALTDSDLASGVKLENLFLAVSGLLCSELDDRAVSLVSELRSYAADLPADDEMRGLSTYIRGALGAIDLQPVLSPSPSPSPWPDIAFADADGRPLTLAGVQELAVRRRAEIVLMVAADDVYAMRYGGTFARSVFRSADVSCLVVILVAGKASGLGRLAATLGIEDDRVVFAGDRTSPAPDQYHSCHPHGMNERPSAYYQCLRFIWLGHVLEGLRLPVLVSDIDVVVQHGIADLLNAHVRDDVVLHRLTQIRTLGNHMVANLVLVQPTEPGVTFARFLRHYADRTLLGGWIDMFIDQVALLMGWHHLQRIPSARIGYFGPYDINSCMFNTKNLEYRRNEAMKFRFLNAFASHELAAEWSRSKPGRHG